MIAHPMLNRKKTGTSPESIVSVIAIIERITAIATYIGSSFSVSDFVSVTTAVKAAQEALFI